MFSSLKRSGGGQHLFSFCRTTQTSPPDLQLGLPVGHWSVGLFQSRELLQKPVQLPGASGPVRGPRGALLRASAGWTSPSSLGQESQ